MNSADRSKWVWTRRAFLQASVVGTLLLSGRFVGPSPVQARELPEGRLTLVNAWTDEWLDVTYRDEAGSYDLEALDDVNYLMRCHYSGEVGAIDVRVLEHVNLVQKSSGLKRISISFQGSGLRIQCHPCAKRWTCCQKQPSYAGASDRSHDRRCAPETASSGSTGTAIWRGRLL